MYDEFVKVLDTFDKDTMTLVLIGDLIDRGIQSKEVLTKALALSQDDEVSFVYIRGNHEQLFLDFINYPTQSYKPWLANGGDKTLFSLLGQDYVEKHDREPEVIAQALKDQYPEFIQLMNASVLYYQKNNLLCVHAGVNPQLKDYRMTSDPDFLWIRDDFLDSKRVWTYIDPEDAIEKTLKIVHGHTPNPKAPVIRYNRINIDGGCCYGGKLIGTLFDPLGDLTKVTMVNYHYHLNQPSF